MAFQLSSRAAHVAIVRWMCETDLTRGRSLEDVADVALILGVTDPLVFWKGYPFDGFHEVLQRKAADRHTSRNAIPVSSAQPPAEWLGWST